MRRRLPELGFGERREEPAPFLRKMGSEWVFPFLTRLAPAHRKTHSDPIFPMRKPAPADRPIHPLLAERWSPYAFTGESVTVEDLLALFEAARWAASSYNEQPWRFIVARHEEPAAFAKVLSCLVPFNQGWAGHAPVLALGLVRTLRPGDGSPNAAAQHDLGLAAASLTVEATHRGLSVHQMSGIVADRIRDAWALPADVLPLTALAIGYAAPLAATREDLRDRQGRPRERRRLPEFVFGERWEEPASFLGPEPEE